MSTYDDLMHAKELFEKDIITEEEFSTIKKQLLGSYGLNQSKDLSQNTTGNSTSQDDKTENTVPVKMKTKVAKEPPKKTDKKKLLIIIGAILILLLIIAIGTDDAYVTTLKDNLDGHTYVCEYTWGDIDFIWFENNTMYKQRVDEDGLADDIDEYYYGVKKINDSTYALDNAYSEESLFANDDYEYTILEISGDVIQSFSYDVEDFSGLLNGEVTTYTFHLDDSDR